MAIQRLPSLSGSDESGLLARWRRRFEVAHWKKPGYNLKPVDPVGALPAISYADFRRSLEREPYLKRRWPYYREAIDLARRVAPRRVLEIGCRYTPLFPVSDRLDYKDEFLFDLSDP